MSRYKLPDGGFAAPVLPSECYADAECSAGTNGRCIPAGRTSETTCSYDACFTDADCDSGLGVCVCAADAQVRKGHTCESGNCRVDADCGTNGFCSLSVTLQPCGVVVPEAFYCHTPQDTCADDTDCDPYSHCRYQEAAARWECEAVAVCSG